MKKLAKVVASVIALTSTAVFSEYGLNMTKGVTSISRDIYDLHMMVFWVCVVIAVIVFGAMFYSVFAHRKSKGAVAAQFHESTKAEILWTLIPVVILIGMAIPATATLIDLEDTSKAEMSIKVTGHQWKWQYDYPEEGISFMSNLAKSSKNSLRKDIKDKPENYLLEVDKHLVIPVDTSVRFLITSNDVIHNWWVPAFGVKQDANPGFINDAWAQADVIGTYRGQCAELCGKDHGFMPIVVDVVSKADYAIWVAKEQAAAAAAVASATKTWTTSELMTKGKDVYETNCAGCHKKDGSGMPPIFPAMIGSPIANGQASEHVNLVLHGKGGMPAFKMLGDADLASVITYERNGFGNTGSVVQPSDIKSAR
ncbi:cytochrome c oxidase subunit II [Candidatus Thioglobus sp.]|nr:cytochrome c oxidase subunit II [Candidatus Thioglobus sp.]MDB3893478.1 cytochrome c oxidase subunit II [Candidatus Thioglobus sp.]MDC0965692.1 cytochrome c oxidase subunit II [Candidatus Thioglobus sp.]MDC3266235.1 cytochrome c oxidase subunit II [Candidatus Thioglobus sp.]